MQVSITSFVSVEKTQAKPEQVEGPFPLSELIESLRRPAAMDVAKTDLKMWSPALYANNYRNNENQQGIWALLYDVDVDPLPTEETIRVSCRDFACFAYSSSSATATVHKWRLGIVLSRSATVEEHRILWAMARKQFSFPVGEAKAACQPWYRPRVGKDGSYTTFTIDGSVIDVDAWLALAKTAPAAPAAPTTPATSTTRAAASNEERVGLGFAQLAAAWPPPGAGKRHHCQMSLVGGLIRAGWSDDRILAHIDSRFDSSVPGAPHRAQTVTSTREKHDAGESVTGFGIGGLQIHIDRSIVRAFCELIGVWDPPVDTTSIRDALTGATTTPAPTAANDTRKWPTAAERAARLGGKCTRLVTGFATLDGCTRGGLPAGRVLVVGGAPGAAKTTSCIHLAHHFARAGIHVGILAADEDASGLLVRIGQLEGFERAKIEDGDPTTRAAFSKKLEALPLLLADADEEYVAVEDISGELRRLAGGAPSVLIVDSIQTVRAEGSQDAGNPRERVNAVMAALKRAAKKDGHLVIATCELARGSYRSRDASEHINDLAAFKESGDVEYGTALALVMRSRPGTSDVYDVSMPKNRIGQKMQFALRLDFARASMAEVPIETPEDPMVPIKARILAMYSKSEFTPLTRNFIAQQVGGRKERTLKAIGELLDANELVESTNGLMRPALNQFRSL